MAKKEIPGYCTLCRSRCGTINTVVADRMTQVRPDTAHPTGSAMCMKGRAAPELVYHAERLRYPMRRTRPKDGGDPGWERISWDTAMTEIAARLGTIRAESGAEAVVFGVTTPSGTPLSDSIDWIERFIRYFGSPNIAYNTENCNWHKDFAHAFTFGCGMPTADMAKADLVILWGHNPAATWLAQATALGQGRANGTRLMVVDPRPTSLATQAESWLRVRPGTDTALALGLIHLLLADDAFDRDFLLDWTNAPLLVREDTGAFLDMADCIDALDETALPGDEYNRPAYVAWDTSSKCLRSLAATHRTGPRDWTPALDIELNVTVRSSSSAAHSVRCRSVFTLLRAHVADYTPECVTAITSVSDTALREAAQLIRDSERVAYHAWSGVAQHIDATQTERAIAVLYALTGSFDVEGGNRLYPSLPINPLSDISQLAASQKAKALGLTARPLGPPARGWVTARDAYDAILTGVPYKVRAWFGFGANPLSTQADVALATQAFSTLEFHVQCDLFETPTARYADILLPVNTPWEREGLRVGFELNAASMSRVQLRQRMVESQGESRGDTDIVADLACRLDMKEAFFGGSIERGWNHMLAPLGLTVAQLRGTPQGVDIPLPERERAYRHSGFATETGRVELYSALLHRHGQPPLPTAPRVPGTKAREDGNAGASGAAPHAMQRYPVVLTSTKNGYFCHSQHRGLASLRKRAPVPVLEIGPTLAAARDIADGDPVVVSTERGQVRFKARIVPDLQPDTVVGEYGWWQACPPLGFTEGQFADSNYNALIDADRHDPISGAVPMRSFRCEVIRDPAFDPALRAWQGWRHFVIEAVVPLADGAIEISFAPTDGGGLPDYLPGQHVQVRAEPEPALRRGGNMDDAADSDDSDDTREPAAPLVRAYSLTGPATSSSERTSLTIAVRLQQGIDATGTPWFGKMSSLLHRRILPGAHVALRAPGGRFTLPTAGSLALQSRISAARPVVMVAVGIGITPFIGTLRTWAAARAPALPEVVLHYANRSVATHAYREEIALLTQALPTLTVCNYYSPGSANHATESFDKTVSAEGSHPDVSPERAVSEPVTQERTPLTRFDRLTHDVVSDARIAQRALVYLCGPVAMMHAFRDGLIARGMPTTDIFFEIFQPENAAPGELTAADPTGTFTVRFARSKREAMWSPKEGSLLDFAERLHIPMPSGCRTGQCESCAVGLLAGRAVHRNGGAPDEEGVILGCQAVPTSDVVLDL